MDLGRLYRLKSTLDCKPGSAQVNAAPRERHAFGFEQHALPLADGERAICPHDPMPRHALVLARRHHRSRESWRLGAEVAIGRDEALWDAASSIENFGFAIRHLAGHQRLAGARPLPQDREVVVERVPVDDALEDLLTVGAPGAGLEL